MSLKISSFNILNTHRFYEERIPLIKRAIQEMDCDIIGLQEINYEGNKEIYIHPDYDYKFSPLYESMGPWNVNELPESFRWLEGFRIDGNAFLVKPKIKVLAEGYRQYSDKLRNAQRMKIRLNDQIVWVVNTHLDWQTDASRLKEVEELLEWMKPMMDCPIIITGDFNATPDSSAYALLSEQFQSALYVANGEEPEKTFPSELLDHEEIMKTWHYELLGPKVPRVYDYIWFRNIKLKTARVVNNIREGTFCPSDHYPLVAEFELS
ncbi:unnamed protein product [Blepharisma stoltei]|uniref:Endonuclease/exonuclease/phosphatase domain-containing protein n=1 Tax=Blepharisma stoltei TaxID=1481888 RepID=A0AAU9JBX1_9CILI|nr:unnamed protein product [Blepharisma stoltei]